MTVEINNNTVMQRPKQEPPQNRYKKLASCEPTPQVLNNLHQALPNLNHAPTLQLLGFEISIKLF